MSMDAVFADGNVAFEGDVFFDSGMDARGYPLGLISPREIFYGSRVVWDACPGYQYLTRYAQPVFGVYDPCGSIVSSVGFEALSWASAGAKWSVIGGALPDGINLYDPDPDDASIDLVGLTGSVGDFQFRLRAWTLDNYAEADFILRVTSALQITNFADFTAFRPYPLANMFFSGATFAHPAATAVYSWDGILLPCGSISGGSQFGVTGVAYASRACPVSGGAAGLYTLTLTGPQEVSPGIFAMRVVVSDPTGLQGYYDKPGPDFSLDGVYTTGLGSDGPPAITLSFI
jgi:hypothetical protein